MNVYLDNGATTMTDPRVVKAMIPYYFNDYGNPSSLHDFGIKAREAIENSRKIIAEKIGAKSEELIFTSGGTESDNLAIIGSAIANKFKGNHLITTVIEHPAVKNAFKYLETKGFKVTWLGVDKKGIISLKELQNAITKKTILVSIMHANNEIGTIQPINKIGEICRKKNVLFHTDAVQSFCKTKINVVKDKIDLLSVSGHKIHGPKGIGALYIRTGIKIDSLTYGGSHEFKKRAGTENVPAIVGFSKAVEISDNSKMQELRDYIIMRINEIPNSKINGSLKNRLVNNVNVSFKGIEGEAILTLLNQKGICVSTGSACSSKSLEPSYVLDAINVSDNYIQGSIRITISRFTTINEIDYFIKQLSIIAKKLTEMSPYA